MSYDLNWSLVFRSTRPKSVSFGLVRISLAEVFFRLVLRKLSRLGWVLVFGDIFQVRFCRLRSMGGSRIKASRPDLCDDCPSACADQVKRVVFSIFTAFQSTVLWTWIQMTIIWTGILLLISHVLQQRFEFSSSRAEFWLSILDELYISISSGRSDLI